MTDFFWLILLADCLSWSCWLFLLAYMWHFDCFFDECFDYFLSWCLWLILLSIKIIFDRFFKAVLNWRALGSECLRSWLLQVNDWNEGLWSLCLKIAHCTLFKMWTNLFWKVLVVSQNAIIWTIINVLVLPRNAFV